MFLPPPCSTPPIGGNPQVCAGSTTLLTNSASGGRWVSSNTTYATVDSISGLVTGVTAGVTAINYTIAATGCFNTINVTVKQSPSSITGLSQLCVGSTSTLQNSTAGGTWSSSNPLQASVGSSSGIVTAIAAGTPVISYALSSGCAATKTITVTALPNAGIITGPSTVCSGSTITLTDNVTGGIWSSSNANATVLNGVVTGILPGIDTINYTFSNSCGTSIATKSITINAFAAPITGLSQVCTGSTTTLHDISIGGTWSSSSPLFATIGSASGIVTGITPGTTVISYALSGGCTATFNMTVNPLSNPGIITGLSNVCLGSSITLTDAAAGGVWSSSNANATVVGGIVTGVIAGIDTIRYSVTNGCGTTTATKTITLNPTPDAGTITGASNVCNGSSITLTDAATGGIWSSSNSNATVSGGVVSGIAAGIDTITYSVTNGCGIATTNKTVEINSLPAPITGLLTVCTGLTVTLNNATAGGTWVSSNAAKAIVGSSSGIVSGISAGTPAISYTLSTGCASSVVVTVNATPNVVVPANQVLCNGAATAALTFTGSVGSTVFDWANNNPSIGLASSGSANIASFIATNSTAAQVTATITVTPVSNGCTGIAQNVLITVNPTPNVVLPASQVLCNNAATAAANFTSGVTGTTFNWVNDNTSIGLAASGTGNIPSFIALNTTNTNNTATITVTPSANGCAGPSGSFTIMVKPTPTVNAIPSQVLCSGASTNPVTFSGIVAGTTFNWTNSTTSIGLGVAGTGNIPSFAAINNTAGPVVATVTVIPAANGCTGLQSSFAITVNINPAAAVIQPLTTPATVCDMTYFRNFGAATLAPAGMRYSWSTINAAISDTGSTRQYALVNFKQAGTATIILTTIITNTGCNTSAGFVETVSSAIADVPAEVIYFNHSFVCLQNNEESYEWGYDDASTLAPIVITGELNQDYDNANPDFTNRNYWVIVTHNGCTQKSYCNKPSGAAMKVASIVVSIYPNPADNKIEVNIKTTIQGDVQMEVTNMLGQKLYAGIVTTGNAQVDVSQFPSGMYLVNCYRGGVKISSSRFVKN